MNEIDKIENSPVNINYYDILKLLSIISHIKSRPTIASLLEGSNGDEAYDQKFEKRRQSNSIGHIFARPY